MDIKVGKKAIEEASKKLSNWGRWGKDDHIGTLNHVTPEDIAKAREDLALQLATTYTDRAGYAVPMPGARVRAMLFGKNFQPGTPINTALRLLYKKAN